MESIEYRRFPVQLIGLAIAAIAAVIIVLTMTGNLFDSDNSDNPVASSRTAPVSRPSNEVVSREQSLFLEWNTILPESRTVEGDVSVTGVDTNGISKPTVIPLEQMRLLEMNQLPGDAHSYLPFPDPSRYGGPLTDY